MLTQIYWHAALSEVMNSGMIQTTADSSQSDGQTDAGQTKGNYDDTVYQMLSFSVQNTACKLYGVS